MTERARLGVDIGDTFTDAALESPAGRPTAKVLTTHAAPERHAAELVEIALPDTPVEAIQAVCPVVFWRKKLRPDSGGAGRRRGGHAGDRLILGLPGGGGFGSPSERTAAALERDRADGLELQP